MDAKIKKDLFYIATISLIVIVIFSLGYFVSNLIKFEKPTIVIEQIGNDINYTQDTKILQGAVVASVNSDKYHYKSCSGAKRIKEKNKIYFENAQEAESAGFILANNCKN